MGKKSSASKVAKAVVSPLEKGLKFVERSLSFLDNAMIKWSIVVLLVLYAVLGAPLLAANVGAVFQSALVQFVLLLVIAYVGIKDLGVALALALAFVASLYMGRGWSGPLDLLKEKGSGALSEVTQAGQNVLGGAENVMGTVLGGAESLGSDVESTAQYLAGGLGQALSGAPAGYNENPDCYASCGSLLPAGSQCQGGDIQGLSCPTVGYQPSAASFASAN